MKMTTDRSWKHTPVFRRSAGSKNVMSRNKPRGNEAVFLCLLLGTLALAGCENRACTIGNLSHPPIDRTGGVEYRDERKLVYVSWYGMDFHGRPTASGEPFDMHALTCAHRDYPFGTQLRVSNPATGNECTCTVNDRGPFIALRDLDLSFGAALQVDLVHPGVAQLFIEPVGLDPSYHDADIERLCRSAAVHSDWPVPLEICLTFTPSAPPGDKS